MNICKSIMAAILWLFSLCSYSQIALPEKSIGDPINIPKERCLNMQQANQLFEFFKASSVFIWNDENNCEDRANAICILLDKWGIANCKGWVINGKTLHKDKGAFYPVVTKANTHDSIVWSHHITAMVPVWQNDQVVYYVIDPATQNNPALIKDWAEKITRIQHTYYFMKNGNCVDVTYKRRINKDSWYTRNSTNYTWTMQGLSGFNGSSMSGRGQIRHNPGKIAETTKEFENLQKPYFL